MTLAIVGAAKVGQAALGWPSSTVDPPKNIKANGICWELVQDPALLKVIEDATTAYDKANDAEQLAQSALTMAGSATRAYYSTEPATGIPRSNRDIWRQLDANKNIIAEWYWDGEPPDGQWVPTKVSSEAISNLDVGKLTAGDATISSAVIQKLAVQIATVIELNADRITTGKLTAGQLDTLSLAAALATILELNADRITSGTIAAERLDVSDLAARIATIINLNADRITAGTINTARLNVQQIAAEIATIIQLNADRIITGQLKSARIDVVDLAANTGFIADLTARIVKSDMFVGKEFQGGVFTGSVFQSPPGGAGFQLTENGYTSRDADGNVTVRLPADGTPAQFRGDVEARSLTASGRVSMQAEGNEIASGADLVLEAGVTPPLTPPTVGTAYATVPLPAAAQGETAAGLTYTDGLWWRTVDAAGTDAGDRLEGFDGNGALVRSFPLGVGTTINGLAALGSEIFILGVKHGQPASTRHVLVYGVDGKFKREWAYTDYGSGTYQPGIGVNGSNLIIGQPRYTGMLTWRTFNPTDGTLISTVDTTYRRYDHVVGIVQTAGDFGTARVVVSYAGGATETFTTTGDKTTAAESFFSAGKNPVRGLVWQGGYFWQYTQQYGIVRLSGIKDPTGNAGGDTDDWWIAATWTGPNGTETTMGQPQRFVFYRRSELQLSAGTPPAGVTGAKFYLARKLFAPTRSDMHLVATFTGASGRLATLPTNWGTSPSPPATNTFATASPAIIRSRSNNFKVDGAGAGKWGPLVFHTDGTMTSNAVPSWVPITSFLNGCTVGDFGFVPAYRSWPDGKVELRGIVKGTLDVIKTIFSLPSAVRSAQPVNMAAATSGGGNSPAVMRVEIGSLATPDAMSINPQGVTRSWVSLDGLYYYQV